MSKRLGPTQDSFPAKSSETRTGDGACCNKYWRYGPLSRKWHGVLIKTTRSKASIHLYEVARLIVFRVYATPGYASSTGGRT